MAIYGVFDEKFFLTQGVARAMGISLTEALADGRLDREGYAVLVAQCQTCPHTLDCRSKVAQACFVDTGAPPYCRNRPALNEIALRG
jgi:hypothetical protein